MTPKSGKHILYFCSGRPYDIRALISNLLIHYLKFTPKITFEFDESQNRFYLNELTDEVREEVEEYAFIGNSSAL